MVHRLAMALAWGVLTLGVATLAGCYGLYDDDCHHRDDDDFDDDFDDDDCRHHDDDDDGPGVSPSEGASLVVLASRSRDPGRIRSFEGTITEIVLESEEIEPRPLYRSEHGFRIDLASPAGAGPFGHALLTAAADLPPAAYGAVTLTVRDLAVELDSGARLPAAPVWRLSFGLRDPLLLGPTEHAFVILDVDLPRSLAATTAGSWPKAIPFAFAEAIRGVPGDVRRPVEVAGVVAAPASDDGSLEVRLRRGRGHVRVRTTPVTRVLARDLVLLAPADLPQGAAVTASGRLDARGGLIADWMLRGRVGRLHAVVQALEPAIGDGPWRLAFEEREAVLLDVRSRVRLDGGDEGSPGDVGSGDLVHVAGRRDAHGDPRALDVDLARPRLEGVVVGRVDRPGGPWLQIEEADGRRHGVSLRADGATRARIGDRVVVGLGRTAPSGSTVTSLRERVRGEVLSIDPMERTIRVAADDQVWEVGVGRSAWIVRTQRGEEELRTRPILLHDVRPSDRLDVSGTVLADGRLEARRAVARGADALAR